MTTAILILWEKF